MLDDMADKSKRLVRTSRTNRRGETPIATPRCPCAPSARVSRLRSLTHGDETERIRPTLRLRPGYVLVISTADPFPPPPSSPTTRQRAVYEDADGVRKEEIEALGGGSNVFSAFYDRLKETRDYHKHLRATTPRSRTSSCDSTGTGNRPSSAARRRAGVTWTCTRTIASSRTRRSGPRTASTSRTSPWLATLSQSLAKRNSIKSTRSTSPVSSGTSGDSTRGSSRSSSSTP